MQVNHEAIAALALTSAEALLNKMKAGQEITPQEMEAAQAYITKALELVSTDALMLAVVAVSAARAAKGEVG